MQLLSLNMPRANQINMISSRNIDTIIMRNTCETLPNHIHDVPQDEASRLRLRLRLRLPVESHLRRQVLIFSCGWLMKSFRKFSRSGLTYLNGTWQGKPGEGSKSRKREIEIRTTCSKWLSMCCAINFWASLCQEREGKR